MKFFDKIKSIGKKVINVKMYNSRRYSGSSGSGGAKYAYGISGDGEGYVVDHYRTRQNARTISHESVHAQALINRFADSVVDVGLKLEPTPDAKILGIDKEKLQEWAEDVESRFHLWAMSKKSDRTETNNFYQNQRLYSKFSERDGDIFTRLYYVADKDAINPLQIQFIDPDQIRGDAYTASYNNYYVDDGITRDSRGRETSYKVFMRNSDYSYKYVEVPRVGVRSKRVFMLHGFCPEFAGQQRGISPLAHALQEFQNITDFSLAKIKKAINQSNMTMYVKPSADNPSSNPFEDMLSTPAGVKKQVFDTGSEIVVASENDLPSVEYCALPEANVQTPGSTAVFNLNEGEDLKLLGDSVAVDSYESFVNAFVSHLSASMGMPVEMLLMKFNANYSASRASFIIFWRICQIRQEEMNSDFNNPIYEAWLNEEVAAGRIQCPGFSDPILRRAWLNCNWIGAPMPSIDPLKEAKAQKENLDMSATTIKRVARQLNGSNAKNNISENKKYFEELPITPWNAKNQVVEMETETETEEEDSINGKS